MTDFEMQGKQMPYKESPEYIARLIEHTTETAIRQSSQRKAAIRPLVKYVAAAAIAVLLVFVGISLWSPTEVPQVAQLESQSPVDDFLNSISDEEVQLLAYYDVDDIAEYE